MNSPIMSRYQAWREDRNARIAFLMLRKQWARNLLREAALTEPGQETEAEFRGAVYRVWIGPRGGVRIHQTRVLPKPLPPATLPKTENLPMLAAFQRVGL